jgi:formylglycine-generating enzyme required for sulfatase activity
MVFVAGGTFTMGFQSSEVEGVRKACRAELGEDVSRYVCFSRGDDQLLLFRDATPAREVFVSAFEIDRYEASVQDYRACAAAGGCDIGALLSSDDRFLVDSWPMVNVTWQDAVDFCTWAGKRLPTEAEWEKAARGTDGRRWPWGNQRREDGANHGRLEDDAIMLTHNYVTKSGPGWDYVPDDSDGVRYAARPGQLVWGESPYGVYDMAGNVAEWVSDYYWDGDLATTDEGGYSDLPDVDPERISPRVGSFRAVRGGSWIEPALLARAYARSSALPDSRSFVRGFRCARDVD